MEQITFTLAATRQLSGKALAGVVGSGDMEVLFVAGPGQQLTVNLTTSVDNSGKRWQALFDRLSTFSGLPAGETALLMTLAASASYIAVPAVVRFAIPEANPSLYVGLSLGVTFPLNILVGIPLYAQVAQAVAG